MTEPNFVCGSYDVTIEHPSDWEITNQVAKDSQTTLNGVLTEDIIYRKHIFTLSWEAMSVENYNNIEELINYSIDNDLDITFTYPKFPQTATGTTVRAVMEYRRRRGGQGATQYHSTVSIVLTEVTKRA